MKINPNFLGFIFWMEQKYELDFDKIIVKWFDCQIVIFQYFEITI